MKRSGAWLCRGNPRRSRFLRRVIPVTTSFVCSSAALLFIGSAAPAAAAVSNPSDVCTTIVLGRGGFGGLQGCRSAREGHAGNGVERNGSGQVAPGQAVGTATIFWNPPFEGSTASAPASVHLVNIMLSSSESDKDTRRGSCPAGTNEWELVAQVASGDDLGGSFTAELCTSFDNGFPWTGEPHTKVLITEPPGNP